MRLRPFSCGANGLITLAILAALIFADCRDVRGAAIIIDHTRTNITAISEEAILDAKQKLHIAYAHTSHGSQVTYGMTGLVAFANGHGKGLDLPTNIFAWNNGGTGGALDLHDYFVEGDLGNPDRVTWASRTRTYLDNPANSDVNVVMWSWCGQVGGTEAEINTYLNLMNQLEIDYPQVKFVYMTGHLNGKGLTSSVHLRNEQIRNYCRANDKILYDFADIETYNPDGVYFGNKYPDDDCSYDPDGALPRNGSGNWAIEWQNSHTLNVDWYDYEAAHSQPLNGNQKAYAAWALWTSIAASLDPNVTWTGGGGSDWSTVAGSGNWKRTSDGISANYSNGAEVVFDDSATGSLTANISAANVSPASVVFNNSSKDFHVAGSKGIVGDATVLKQGTAKTTLSSVNSYSGRTTVEGGTLQLNGAGAHNPVLNLGGADIKAGKMVFDYAGGSDPRTTIRSLLTASYHSGSATHFDTGKFQSSTADADYGLGWTTTINYQVIVARTLYGDATLDGDVGVSDLAALGQNWNGAEKNWAQGDFNYDGKVDISDLSLLGQHWNQSAAGFAGTATVPEPGSMMLLAAGGATLLGLARRRSRRGRPAAAKWIG